MLRSSPSVASLCILLAVAAAGGCSSTARVTADRLPAAGRHVLANGFRVIVQEYPTSDIVAVQLWVGVGSRDERPDERGFSHFAEHMLFKGTETLGRGFVDQEVEAVGGRSNAGTSYDYTYYYMLLPAARAVRGIEVLADMAFNSRFDADELAREREVVFEEIRLGEDNPRSAVYRRLYDLLLDGHAYGSPVLGEPAVLNAATRATLRGYYKRHYVPDNMVLVVVGAVSPDEVVTAATRSFGTVARTGYVRPVPTAPAPLHGVRRRAIERPERQASLGLGWIAPVLGHEDMAAVDLLAYILGGSRSSRLNQALRERARLVSGVNASYSALQSAGILTVIAQFEPADEAKVEAAIVEEIGAIASAGVTDRELERAITASEADRVFSEETAEGLALAYGRAETTWSLAEDRRYLDRVRATTREQVQDAARKYLGASHARLALRSKGGTQ